MKHTRRAAAVIALLICAGPGLATAGPPYPGQHLGGPPIAPPSGFPPGQVPVDAGASLSAAGPAAIKSSTLLIWSHSRPFVEGWVRTVPPTDAARLERLRALFVRDGCAPDMEPVGNEGLNLVCTLPGEAHDVVVIGAHYEHSGRGEGAIENWSGAAMLPLLYHSMQATKRQTTFVFVAFDGKKGAQTYFKRLEGGERARVRAVLDLNDLGLSPLRSCSFPDNSTRFLQDLGLEQVLLGVARNMGMRGMPQRESCYEMIKVDDTDSFRKAGIPALIVHSVTHDKHSLPGSEQDTSAAIDAVSYYNSYQLLATYLCMIDPNLKAVLVPGAYDPMRAALTAVRTRPKPSTDLPANADLFPGSDAPAPLPPPAARKGLDDSDASSPKVVLDVIATDKNGVPLQGLTRDKFEVLQDGRPQQILTFEEHSAASSPQNSGALHAPSGTTKTAARDYFTNADAPIDSATVLVLDSLNTPNSDAQNERRSMIAFLKNIPPQSHIAVFGLGSRLWMFQGTLQGLPSESATPPTAVDRVPAKQLAAVNAPPVKDPDGKAGPDGNAPNQASAAPDAIAGDATPAPATPVQEAALEKTLTDFESDPDLTACPDLASKTAQTVNGSESAHGGGAIPATRCTLSAAMRAERTLDGFQQILRYLDSVSGRKSIVWFSQAFPLPFTPDQLARTAHAIAVVDPDQALDYSAAMIRLSAQLAAARVSIYPVSSSEGIDPEQRDDMKSIAEATGGRAFYKTDQLPYAVETAVRDNSSYYSVGYTPAVDASDGALRRVKVEVNGAPEELVYRRAHFDVALARHSEAGSIDSGNEKLDPGFASSLRPGFPPVRDILFNARAKRAVEQRNSGTVRYILDYCARYDVPRAEGPSVALLASGPPAALSLGQQKATLIFAAAGNDADGRQIQSLWRGKDLDLSSDARARLSTDGVRFQMEFDVPLGAATLTLGVFDPATHRMGTVEVPLSAGAK